MIYLVRGRPQKLILYCVVFLLEIAGFEIFAASYLPKPIRSNTILYPASEGNVLTKTLQDLMICDTSGNLMKGSPIPLDGSIIFDCGRWNSSGLPLIFRKYKIHFIKNTGDTLCIDPGLRITNAYPFHNGFALIQKDNKYNFINTRGKLIGKTWFDYAENFSDGLAVAGFGKWESGVFIGKLGYIDTSQESVIPIAFESAETFSNKVAKVWSGDKMFVLNNNGKVLRQSENAGVVERGLSFFNQPAKRSVKRPEDEDISNFSFISDFDTLTHPVRADKVWEYKNKKGTAMLLAMADVAMKFSEGFAPVKKEGRWNYINESGVILLSDWYDDVSSFKQGIAQVKLNGKSGFINRMGEFIIPLMAPVKFFSGGNACIESSDAQGKVVKYVDKNGSDVIPWMREVGEFINGQAEIKRDDGMVATIDVTGQIIETWHYKAFFSGDKLDVIESNNFYTFRDKNGRMNNNWVPDIVMFSEGLLAIQKDSAWGYIDKNGRTIIPFTFEECWNFRDGIALVKQNSKYAWIDKNGRNIANDWFEGVGEFSMDLVAVQKKDHWGYMNSKGEVVIKPAYDAAAAFSEGFALVKKGNNYGYINRKGKKLTNFEFTAGGTFSNGVAMVKKKKSSGYIDRLGTFYAK
jgi:hypothetical protein